MIKPLTSHIISNMTEMDNKNLAQESWVAEVFGVHALEVIFRVHALKAIPLEFNDVNG